LGKRIETVFFDLHGTLVTFDVDDVEERIRAAYQTYAAAIQSAVPWAVFFQAWIQTRSPLEQLARQTLRELQIAHVAAGTLRTVHGEIPEAGAIVENMVRAYTEVWVQNLTLSPEVQEVLRTMKQTFKLALVSNYADTATVWWILEKFNLLHFFDTVVVSAEVGWRKPHPAIFLEALSRTGSRPESTVHVGDEPHHDVAGAQGVGIAAILYDPQGKHESFDGCRVARLSQVPEHIRRLEREDGQ
jgi:putative hydrolase of the HAD superfamily